jgi:hypothetical protein
VFEKKKKKLRFGVKWSPLTHKLCSPLARQQVFLVLLMCHRAERRVGYPFPKELKLIIINEMLAPPTEEFVRSVLPSACAASLLDRSETVCFRNCANEQEVLVSIFFVLSRNVSVSNNKNSFFRHKLPRLVCAWCMQ